MEGLSQASQPQSSSRAAKRAFGEQTEPSSKRCCKIDLLRAGSQDSAQTGGSPSWAAGLEALAAAASPSASPAGVAEAAAAPEFASAHGSAESHQSRLAVAPDPASPSTAVAPAAAHAAAAAAAAAAAREAEAAAAQAAAAAAPESRHSLVPTPYLAELAAANECLKRLPLPGGVPYHAVHSSCAMLPLCCHYAVPPAAVALGASYFQRLLVGSPPLRDAALQCGFFSWVDLPGERPGAPPRKEVVMHAVPGEPDLLTILCTCIYLGVKVTDGPQFARQLSHMLSHVLGAPVPSDKAVDLEMRCLKNLQWRLGPYCCARSTPVRV